LNLLKNVLEILDAPQEMKVVQEKFENKWISRIQRQDEGEAIGIFVIVRMIDVLQTVRLDRSAQEELGVNTLEIYEKLNDFKMAKLDREENRIPEVPVIFELVSLPEKNLKVFVAIKSSDMDEFL
jgi:hypothetical protein